MIKIKKEAIIPPTVSEVPKVQGILIVKSKSRISKRYVFSLFIKGIQLVGALGKSKIDEMDEQGLGYIIVMSDPMIGAKREWLDLCRSEERRVGKECRSRWSPYH